VSPLLRSELSIVLYPERVALLRTERRLTLRGYRRRVCDRKIVPCEDGVGERPWSAALDALGAALPSIITRKMVVNVILSNHFLHYALVPWFDKLSDEEELALAQHRFEEMCGAAAGSLSIRVSPGPPGVSSLASAVDRSLLDELAKLMGRMRIDLRSVQPHLMMACNSCRGALDGRNAWFALLEPNSLCLAVLQQGRLVWIRKLRIGDDWRAEMPAMLERESYLANVEADPEEVLLWAPHLDNEEIPTGWRWNVRQLMPSPAYP